MLRAMLYKELRETGGIALLGLLWYLYLVAEAIGWNMPMRFTGSSLVPFVGSQFDITVAAGALCLALGLRQTVGESLRSTWLFVLHRPMDRRRIIAVKLATGLGLYLLLTPLPILAYALWAATPGKHASPFDWSMTLPTWQTYLLMSGLYLGAFLTGMRSGRWVGTRLVPVVGVGVLLVLIYQIPAWWIFGPAALILLEGCLVVSILFVTRTRDF
jgi:hypothetical protein